MTTPSGNVPAVDGTVAEADPGTGSVTVRFFAAAAAAAQTDEESWPVSDGATVDTLVARLGAGRRELARVLARCSYLCDGIAVRDTGKRLIPGCTIDVLPPFAGG
ncbi:MoaD/ThiS family protein [Rhodococcus sp. D2-41]|uniref:MoaD/ThiS family protein n=1 Tax=Speluncibacter jeojiensis TaxID=2710754 RepID=A0A9X4LYW5_9ACTN|nr:MoaD/ThiS family protein [Rhodococcus sp. D2-41]MDG3011736.1 MoaD/ThiS family protein [Rhodococcus sp. D2-41]MDG3014910.1 MoaD/ThiS family protein [Corynebacteriales bacterium D3-21]